MMDGALQGLVSTAAFCDDVHMEMEIGNTVGDVELSWNLGGMDGWISGFPAAIHLCRDGRGILQFLVRAKIFLACAF